MERLKDETDLLVTDVGKLVVIHLAHQLVIQLVDAGCGNIETPDDVHQRGLTGS